MASAGTSLRSLIALAAACTALSACSSPATIAPSGPRPPALADPAERIPAAAFFRAPVLSHLTLSPRGNHIAGIATQDGVELLVVRPTGGGEVRTLAKLDEPGMQIRTVGWPSEERLLVSLEMPSALAKGVRARQTRLLSVPLDGSDPRYLGRNWKHVEFSQVQDDIIDWLPDDPEHVLLSWWQPGDNGASVRQVDVESGTYRVVASSMPFVTGWAVDHRHQVRAGWGYRRAGTRYFLYARVGPDDDFEKVIEFDPFEEAGFFFAGFSEDPARIYVFSDDETGREAVYSYDLRAKQLGPMVFGHPEVDVEALYTSPVDGRLLAIGYVTDRPQLHFLDEEARRDQAWIDRALPGTTNWIVSSDLAERLAIVQASADTVPPKYYLYDRASGDIGLLVEAYPELRPEQLAPMRYVSFRARDGLEIHGYLTLPKGAEPSNLPTIVYPHGGPSARDVWGFDPTVQFLASRGFAVFQPNFRGSTGYGSRHTELGYQEWGGAMQDDVTDGTRWLIEQGIADPARIGIYGASYGGYTALMALVKTPELFRAGASLAGVTDLITLLNDDEWYGLDDWNTPTLGSKWSDRKKLKQTSPAQSADRIRAPVLIAHGTQDPIVHVKQAEAMKDALEDAGAEVETYLYRDEVHGFIDERNQIDFHQRLAAFFERALAADPAVAAEPPGQTP